MEQGLEGGEMTPFEFSIIAFLASITISLWRIADGIDEISKTIECDDKEDDNAEQGKT